MNLTRPPAMTDQEADRHRASGGRVYQTAEDPRLSRLLNWFLGIIAPCCIAGGIRTDGLLQSMRDKQLIQGVKLDALIARPEPATERQVANLQRPIGALRSEMRKLGDSTGSNSN